MKLILTGLLFYSSFVHYAFEFASGQQLPNNYICSESYCEKYLETTGCDALDEACRAQNLTLNGIILPSQTPCSCCESCLEHLSAFRYGILYLGEGSDCTIGMIGAPVPTTVCGPYLACARRGEEEHATCQYRMDTTCLTNVRDYSSGLETGTLGNLMTKPDCDTLGNFNAFRCIPGQICYCVDKEGQRIFGESLYTSNMAIRMRCECSRRELHSRETLGLSSSNNFVRCNEMGSYDSILCLGDKCICVDPHSGSPVSPLYNRTNLEDLQRDWKCFDGDLENLERLCEKKREQLSKNTPIDLNKHALVCQPDGWFARVQRNETHFYCVDKFGGQIGSYGQLAEDGQNINCNCARVVDLLRNNNRIELPQCCANGNFKRINCRRGYCYCVDTNGHQISAEVPRANQHLLTCSVTVDGVAQESDCN